LLPEEVSVFMETGFFGMEGKLNSGDAHLAVDYQEVLKKGLIGYEKRVLELKDNLDLCISENIDKYQFYKAVLVVIDAVKTYANRFSMLAKELANKHTGKRKEELLKISQICQKVPYYPAKTFQEALQSTWFIQLILQIESNGHSLSYGRFDQYIYPYYQHDIDNGLITEDEAVELLTNLWIKTMTINKVRSQAHTFSSAGSPMYQNVTIGGQTPDKKDATNKLSYLVLKSVAQTRLPQPNLTVRYHRNMPKEFLDEAIEVMKLGTGMPAFNSDEVIIPSFIEKGVKEEDAYNYSAIGCVETAVPGKWGYRCTGMSYMNFPRILLIAMNDGIDPTSNKRFVEGCGHFRDMKSFDELMNAINVTIRKLTRMSVIVENAIDLALERDVPDILCSALVQDCIGRGKTIKEGGAIYDFISGLQVGIANMADSLAAIKKLVFEEKKNTPPVINVEDKELTVGDTFDPLEGVTATDEEDGDISGSIEVLNNEVDTTKVGIYEVTYKVTDSQGASTTKTIYVTVNPKQEVLNEVPVIDASDRVLTEGDAFDVLEGVTATDKEDGDISGSIEVLNMK